MELRSILTKKISLPLPDKLKSVLSTIVILVAFYYVFFYIGYWLRDEFHPGFVHLSLWSWLSAVLTGSVYFISRRPWQKGGQKTIIPAIQVALAFSALPYVLYRFTLPSANWNFYISALPLVLLIFVIILPEILVFVGLIFIRKGKAWLSIVFIIFAALVALETYPIRVVFRFDTAKDAIWRIHMPPDELQPYGKLNKEEEFKRSLQTIYNLERISKESSANRLHRIFLQMPDLSIDSLIFKIDLARSWYAGLSEHWDTVFQEQSLEVDLLLDSDGDGLSDFEEAMLLCDAYDEDTDDDGYDDYSDSDPVNPLVKSEIAFVHAAIIEHSVGMNRSLALVDNDFWGGEGSIANFDGHVILLWDLQHTAWGRIFGLESYWYGGPPVTMKFGRHVFGILQKIAVVEDMGGMMLLVKWNNEWRVIAYRGLWIS